MKYTLILFLLAFSSLSFCQTDTLNREEIKAMFHEVNESDAGHIGEKIRETVFVENFNLIINLIKSQGYPIFPENKKNKKLNQSIEHGMRRTFFHILQTNPELLLNKEIIDLISKEVSAHRLDPDVLKFVLSAFQHDQDMGNVDVWSEEVERNFYLAIREWDIKLYPTK